MTPKQREEDTMRNEFERCKQSGEDSIQIKFVIGIPNILQKTEESCSKSTLLSFCYQNARGLNSKTQIFSQRLAAMTFNAVFN